MFAATQRRHFSYYFALPLVLVIVPLLVAKLVALQRADVIAELADRVAHRDSREAVAAVRQLASMPKAPLSILVAAATSADREVAEEAKLCIGRLLRRAERQIEAGSRVGTVARQLAELAESLDARQEMFSAADYPWLFGTTGKVLRLANRIPPRHAPLVALHCDAILAGIAAQDAATTDVADNEPEVEESFLGEGVMVEDEGQSRQALLEVVRESPDPALSENRFPTTNSEPPGLSRRDKPAGSRSFATTAQQTREDASAATSAEELLTAPWRASWSHPIFRMMPARPINAPPVEESAPAGEPATPVREPAPVDREALEPPLTGLDSRSLLRCWLEADGSDVFPLEQELTRRGFGRLSERLVQQLFSLNSEDRLSLVDDVLTEPGVDARPWLVLLCEDSDADVRLLAVTIMATSNDAALVEKAWQVSIHDRDPRIAGLAGRLRETTRGRAAAVGRQ